MPSRFLSEIPDDLVDREVQEPRSFQPTWADRDRPRPEPARGAGAQGATFGLGDDVEHATMGEGVVIGLEPGGLVVVRFRSDGSERKLMMDYAPLKKR